MTGAKNVLLIEPGYRNKYPPLGLMKIAAYHKARGDRVTFEKDGFAGTGHGTAPGQRWDRVYVTTLFSFEWKRTARAIDTAVRRAGGAPRRVWVGGIAASLMHEAYASEPQWKGIRFVKGLLDRAPAEALGLEPGEFGWDTHEEAPIETRAPDYAVLDDTTYAYAITDAYFGYASRGCVRSAASAACRCSRAPSARCRA